MNWSGDDKRKEAFTNDGYHLVIKQIEDSKYMWKVFYQKKLIMPYRKNPVFKNSIPKAKRQAIRLMVNHMLKKID